MRAATWDRTQCEKRMGCAGCGSVCVGVWVVSGLVVGRSRLLQCASFLFVCRYGGLIDIDQYQR